MAQTLNATLAAAQLLTERKPLIEVLSDKFVPDIPFVGQRLASDFSGGPQERNPNAITLSDGRIVVITTFLTSTGGFAGNVMPARLSISNANRSEFTDYSVNLSMEDVNLVELPDGTLGVFSIGAWKIIDVADNPGAILSSGSITGMSDRLYIPAWVAPARNSGHNTCIPLANGTYLAAYVANDSAVYGEFANIDIKILTSADFHTWSAPAAISMPYLDRTHAKYSPFLFQTEDGVVNLLFEYVELSTGDFGTTEKVNIYHFVSSDNGATWGIAPGASAFGAITNYPDFTVTARHPYAIPLGAGSWRIAYHESMSALHMNTSAINWDGEDHVVGLHFDEVTRRAYVVNNFNAAMNIVVVDPDTWAPIKTVGVSGDPAFSAIWIGGVQEVDGERELTVVRKGNHIAIYNGTTDQITEFHFEDWVAYGVTANITPKARASTGGPAGHEQDMNICKMSLDYENKILYLYWQISYIWGGCLGVGKIDLTQAGPEYVHDVLFTKSASGWGFEFSEAEMMAMGGTSSVRNDFQVFPDDNLIVITGGWTSNMEGLGGPWIGATALYSMSGDLIKHFNDSLSDTYSYRGLQRVAKVGSYLYGVFLYEPNYDNDRRRGLARIDLGDLSVSYFRPSFASVDEYAFKDLIAIKDGDELLLSSGTYGASRFVIADATWELYTNDTLPGLFPYANSCESLAYDTVNEGIFLGSYTNQMLIYFNEDGYFNQPLYLGATFDGVDWTYGSASPLVTTMRDRDLVMVVDPETSGGMYSFWVHENTDGYQKVRWDKDLAEFDLTDYLVGGSDVSIKRSIDGSPHKLSFSVTHGHLFDPHNVDSLWSSVLKKFRRIRVRFGEDIAGTSYWHDAGTFVVTTSKVSYKRGAYPVMQVEAEDLRTWWEDAEIVATDHYEMTPEQILTDILTNPSWGGMAGGDIVLPAMEGSYEVWFQWLDTTVKKVVDALCNRFGYFPTITVDNKFTCRKISNLNAVDHTYANDTMIISFTPNDDFSDFTNRVTVTGETREFIDVLYEEESVGSLYGTSGWWGAKQTFDVWYSEDHKRKAKNPRLRIIESCIPNRFIEYLGGGAEYIESVDVDEFFCRIRVEVPDMSTYAWITGASVLVIGTAACIAGIYNYSAGFGAMIGFMVLLSIVLYILSGIVSWQYEIWARPYGQQRIGCSGEANDVDLQDLLNRINPKKIDEPLCIDDPQCQWLAEHELMIVMAQRNRVGFEKVAHLQDEEGDTIVIPHPYTGKNMRTFITDLTRSFHVPSGAASEKAGFTDSIEGWKVAPV